MQRFGLWLLRSPSISCLCHFFFIWFPCKKPFLKYFLSEGHEMIRTSENYCFSLIFHYIKRSLAISDLQHGELYFREECLQIKLQLIFWSSYLNLKACGGDLTQPVGHEVLSDGAVVGGGDLWAPQDDAPVLALRVRCEASRTLARSELVALMGRPLRPREQLPADGERYNPLGITL